MEKIKLLNQKLNQVNFDKIYFNFLSFSILFIILFIISLNLNYPFLWYDEAITFWIAKGINPDSLPYTEAGNFTKCIYYNKFFNLDPGGFSILLYFWTKISDNHFFLRILPFLLYIIFFYYLIKIIFIKIKDFSLSIFTSILITILFNYYTAAYELRGYSMELLTIVFSIYILVENQKNINLKKIFFKSLIICILMTSRYSSIIIVIISLVLMYLKNIKNIKDNKQQIYLTVVIYTPFILISILVYYFSYQTQKTFSDKLPYLNYLKDNPKLLFEFNNLIFISILFYFLIILLKFKTEYKYLILFTLLTNIIFIILSFLGKYPWDPMSSRCNVISFPIILTFLLTIKKTIIELIKKNNFKSAILCFTAFITINYSKQLYKRYDKPVELYSDILSINFSKKPQILVDRWSNLSLRYLYEYGNLKKYSTRHNYPQNFTLLSSKNKFLNTIKKTDIWYKNKIENLNIKKYDILITPEMSKYYFFNKLNWKSIKNNNILFFKKNDSTLFNISF